MINFLEGVGEWFGRQTSMRINWKNNDQLVLKDRTFRSVIFAVIGLFLPSLRSYARPKTITVDRWKHEISIRRLKVGPRSYSVTFSFDVIEAVDLYPYEVFTALGSAKVWEVRLLLPRSDWKEIEICRRGSEDAQLRVATALSNAMDKNMTRTSE